MAYGQTNYATPANAPEQQSSRLDVVIKQLEESLAHAQQQGNVLRRIADRLTGPVPESVGKDVAGLGNSCVAGSLETVATQLAQQLNANDHAIERIGAL